MNSVHILFEIHFNITLPLTSVSQLVSALQLFRVKYIPARRSYNKIVELRKINILHYVHFGIQKVLFDQINKV